MKYEITIRQLEEYTEEENKQLFRNEQRPLMSIGERSYSDKNFHEVRALYVEISEEEFKAVKKAIIEAI